MPRRIAPKGCGGAASEFVCRSDRTLDNYRCPAGRQVTAANLSNPPSSLVDHDSTVATGGFNRHSLRAGCATTISGSARVLGDPVRLVE